MLNFHAIAWVSGWVSDQGSPRYAWAEFLPWLYGILFILYIYNSSGDTAVSDQQNNTKLLLLIHKGMLVFRGTNMLVAGPCVKPKEVWVVYDHQNDGNSTLALVFKITADYICGK